MKFVSYDEKIFESFTECLEYEFDSLIYVFDYESKRILFKELITEDSRTPDYVIIATNAALEVIENYLNYMEVIYDGFYLPREKGIFYYDEGCEEWKLLIDKMEKLNAEIETYEILFEKFRKIHLDLCWAQPL